MKPTSLPTNPDPPAGQQLYTLGDLVKFKIFDRQSFKAAFGEDAPNYDSSRPPKLWFDTSDPGGAAFRTYYTVANGGDGKPSYQAFSLPVDVAATVNIPGSREYPKWEPAPTGARIGNLFGGSNPVNPGALSTRAQADQLAAETGATVSEMDYAQFAITYPVNEDRREWLLTYANGLQFLAGVLLAAKYHYGVDAPGSWDTKSDTGPIWIPAVPPIQAAPTLSEVPRPMRNLNPDESFRVDGFTGQIRVQRGVLAVDSAGYGPADRSNLSMVNSKLDGLRALMLEAMGRKS